MAADVVVTDPAIQDVPHDRLLFSLVTGFTSTIASVTNKEKLLALVLQQPIPPDQFRPVCVPPEHYVTKIVKTASCGDENPELLKVSHWNIQCIVKAL